MNETMNPTSTCFFEVENVVATIETEKGLLAKLKAELLSFATRKEAKGARTGDNRFIETIFPMCSGLALHAEKAIMPCCRRKVSEPLVFSSELERSWRRCCENIQDL